MRRIVLALVLAFLSLPAFAAPCAGFTDVDTSSSFCSSVAWMKNRGITLGCTATQYCPNDPVTRLQMAAFMYRLGFQNTLLNGGNAFGGTAVVGTTDAFAVEVRAGGQRVMSYEPNAISPNLIAGSPANNVTAGVRGATIAGGGVAAGDTDPGFGAEAPNRVTDAYGTVGGGYANRAGDDAGTIQDSAFATVGGGAVNIASGFAGTVAGGSSNTSGDYGTVAGGLSNTASSFASVAGGHFNTASGDFSTVAGGNDNTASGDFSTVAGGLSNTASGLYTFAAGRRAKATMTGSFMWADSRDVDFGVPVVNFFGVRATGGVGFTVAIDPVSGGGTQYCDLLPGVVGWQCVSDRNAKENFEPARGDEILAKLVAMPLFSWNFKGTDPAIRNLGPTAQDFKEAFGLGSSDKTIASGNVDGVVLAAIQGLNAKLEAALAERDARIASLVEALALQREAYVREIAELKQAVAVLFAQHPTVKDADRVAARLP